MGSVSFLGTLQWGVFYRAIILLSGKVISDEGIGISFSLRSVSLSRFGKGTACRRVGTCMLRVAKLGISSLCVTRVGGGYKLSINRGFGPTGSRGTERPRYAPRGRSTVVRTFERFKVV